MHRRKRESPAPSPLPWETLLCLFCHKQAIAATWARKAHFGNHLRKGRRGLASRSPFAEGASRGAVLRSPRQETGNESALPCSPPTNKGRSIPGLASPVRPFGKLPSSDIGPFSRPSSCSPSHGTCQRSYSVVFAASLWTKLQQRFRTAAENKGALAKELLAKEGRVRAASGSLRLRPGIGSSYFPLRKGELLSTPVRDKPSSRPKSRKTSCRLLKSEPWPTPPSATRTPLTYTPRGKQFHRRQDPASSSIASGRGELYKLYSRASLTGQIPPPFYFPAPPKHITFQIRVQPSHGQPSHPGPLR